MEALNKEIQLSDNIINQSLLVKDKKSFFIHMIIITG